MPNPVLCFDGSLVVRSRSVRLGAVLTSASVVGALLAVGLPQAAHADDAHSGTASLSGALTYPAGADTATSETWVALIDTGSGETVSEFLADSSYSIDSLEAGTYRLLLAPEEASSATEWFNDAEDEADATLITLTDGQAITADVELNRGATVSGSVTGGDIAEGEGWVLALREEGGQWYPERSTEVAASGDYSVGGLRSGDYTFVFSDWGYLDDPQFGEISGWQEWMGDSETFAAATTITVSRGSDVTASDVQLDTVAGKPTWPTVTGALRVGSTLTATPGAWPSHVTPSFRWYADGELIPGATSSTLKLTTAHIGTQIVVEVLGDKGETMGWESKMGWAEGPVLGVFTSAPTPTISGSPKVGVALTAKTATWVPAATTTYQWYASGAAISGATRSTFTPTSAHLGKTMTVKVTGSRDGYVSASKTSKATAKVAAGTLKTAAPTISGTAGVGYTLSAKAGTWTSGTSLSYRWYANGTAITGATKSTFKITSAQKDRAITVKVTGKKSGYTSVTRTSKATAKVLVGATPTVSGSAIVGQKLTAKVGTWTSGTSRSYQWYADGKAITGARSSTYTVPSSQRGKKISVRVTGKKSGYATVVRASKETLKVALTAAPKISGTVRAGSKLTAATGTWTSGTSFSYQWYASGKAISGATSRTLSLKSGHVGKTITVKVTGRKSGHTTASRTSSATGKVAKAPVPARVNPTSSGSCPSSHPIKGNHSSSGEWIYHVPGGQFYSRTNPEDCFRTEAAARAAGYRASQR